MPEHSVMKINIAEYSGFTNFVLFVKKDIKDKLKFNSMETKNSLRVATGIITFSALVCLIGPYAADWNKTHIYNPRWPPHAKFHNGQTMLLGTFLALGALWYTWKRTKEVTFKRNNLNVATYLALGYWLTQSTAIFFPGAGFTDPEFGPIPRFLGLPAQLLFDIPQFVLLGIAFFLINKKQAVELIKV
jgi:hypothetical protein